MAARKDGHLIRKYKKGHMIVSKPATKEYRDNYDRTFKSPYDHYKVRGISKTKAKRKKKRG